MHKSQSFLSPPRTRRLRAGLTILKSGQSVGEHTTGRHEEILVILSGTALLMANGKRKKISVGSIAYNPPHTVHNVANCGRSLLRYVYVVS